MEEWSDRIAKLSQRDGSKERRKPPESGDRAGAGGDRSEAGAKKILKKIKKGTWQSKLDVIE